MWKLDRDPWWQPYKPWHWTLIFTSHGLAMGRSWTKRGAEKSMLIAQGQMFGADW